MLRLIRGFAEVVVSIIGLILLLVSVSMLFEMKKVRAEECLGSWSYMVTRHGASTTELLKWVTLDKQAMETVLLAFSKTMAREERERILSVKVFTHAKGRRHLMFLAEDCIVGVGLVTDSEYEEILGRGI